MMTSVGETLGNLKTYAPNYKGQGYEIGGFVWFQGFNDKFSDHSTSTYQENMANFIRDVRKDLKSPELPFVIGAMGHQGTAQKGTTKILAEAQIATAKMPEFKGNVITVKTADFWDYDAEKAFKKKKRIPGPGLNLVATKGITILAALPSLKRQEPRSQKRFSNWRSKNSKIGPTESSPKQSSHIHLILTLITSKVGREIVFL